MNDCGYLTIAENSNGVDYVRLAYILALNLRLTQRHINRLSVLVRSIKDVPESWRWAFDQIIEMPWRSYSASYEWKVQDKWKSFHLTPYSKTVLLDADMWFSVSIDDWWPLMETKPMMVCVKPMTFRNDPILDNPYRKDFKRLALPNVHTAFMFFNRFADETLETFEEMRKIYTNWNRIEQELSLVQQFPSGDLAMALALQRTGLSHHAVWPGINLPRIVHMKGTLQYLHLDNWIESLSYWFDYDGTMTIGGFKQIYPVHYFVKSAITDHHLKSLESHFTVLPAFKRYGHRAVEIA